MASFIVPAAATVASAGIGAAGNKSAAKSAERSNAAALAFQKEQEQYRQKQYDQNYLPIINSINARRDALLKRYGVTDIPAYPVMNAINAGQAQTASGQPRPTGMQTPGDVAVPRSDTQPQNIAALMRSGAAETPEVAQPRTWNDWRRYGLE